MLFDFIDFGNRNIYKFSMNNRYVPKSKAMVFLNSLKSID